LPVAGARDHAALADPKIVALFAEVGSVPKSMTPADFGKFILEDTDNAGRLTRSDKSPVRDHDVGMGVLIVATHSFDQMEASGR
jgi:hypothetical protein